MTMKGIMRIVYELMPDVPVESVQDGIRRFMRRAQQTIRRRDAFLKKKIRRHMET